MTTFSTAANALGSQWSVVVTLEGSGNSSGLFYYCSTIPTYAAADSNYRPWLRAGSWPDIMSESVNPMGGLPQAGNISLDLVDIDDTLTSEWRTERGPTTLANGAITSTATSITVNDASNITTGDVIYMGNEAILVGGKTSDTLETLTRGHLDTDAIAHTDDEEVYLSTPYLRGRRIRMYVIPMDAGSASDLQLFGVYHVDSFSMSADFNGYILQGRSQLKYLDRLVAHDPVKPFIINTNQGSGVLFLSVPGPFNPWDDGAGGYFKFGDEVVVASLDTASEVIIKITKRGAMGTAITAGVAGFEMGDPGNWIIGAETDGPGGFRFIDRGDWSQLSSGEKLAITRASHLWQKSAHWVDIILCIMTSSAGDDELELLNGDDTYGNWASLPVGYGLGIPSNKIDFESFIKIKNETPDFLFKSFFIGHEAQPVREIISEQILRPIGAYITTETGHISLRMPTIPLKDEAVANWDDDVVLSKRAGDRRRVADMKASQDVSKIATTVNFKVRNASGGFSTQTFNDVGFEGWSVGRSYYARDEKPLEFFVPSIRIEGSEAFVKRLGMRKLFRFRRPMWKLSVPTGLDQYAKTPGDLVGVTHAELPDTEDGTRGWTSVACEITDREISVNEGGVGLGFKLLAFTTTRVGRVSASGYTTGLSGPDGSGDYTLDIAENVYTDPHSVGGLPTTDAASFRAGDAVTLQNLDGSDAAATATQIVQSVSSTQVVIDGNFSSALATGLVLIFADRASAVSDQHDGYVYFAGQTDSPPNIGSSTDKPWRYGE